MSRAGTAKWVSAGYEIRSLDERGEKVTATLVHKRLRLIRCDFDFKSEPEIVEVKYQLVHQASAWKIDGPVPDYPDVGADTVFKALAALADSVNETSELSTRQGLFRHD